MNSIGLPENGRWPSLLALTIGLAYSVVGFIQVLSGLGIIPAILGTTDVLGGALLVIVGAVFLTGVKPLQENNKEGYAYIAVGYILAAVLFGLQVLVIATNALGWLLRFEDWLGWSLTRDLTPSFWMFIALAVSTGSLVLIGAMRSKLRPTAEVVG